MRRISSQGSRQPRRGSLGEGMGPEGPKSSLPAPPPPASRLQGDSTNRAEPWAGALLAGAGSGSGVGGWPSRRDLQCHLSIDQLLASLSFLLGENCQCPGLWADRPSWACPRWHRGYRGVDRPTPIPDGGQGRYSGFCKVMMRLNRGQLSLRDRPLGEGERTALLLWQAEEATAGQCLQVCPAYRGDSQGSSRFSRGSLVRASAIVSPHRSVRVIKAGVSWTGRFQ